MLLLLSTPLDRGVCKTRTGYLRMADVDLDGKLQMEKCGNQKNAENSMIIIFVYINSNKACVCIRLSFCHIYIPIINNSLKSIIGEKTCI